MIRQPVSSSQRLLGSTALAVAVLLTACSKNSGDDYDLAKDSMAKAETPTAIIHLKAALQKDPSRWEARALLGYALMRTGDAAGATVELEKAYAAQFNPDEVVPALATAILQTGKPQVVVDRFSKLKMQTPAATAALQASLGIAHWQLGQKAEAEAAVARALEAAPVQSNALMLKANIAASKGDIDGAIELMNWLLQRNPKDLQAMLLLSQFQRSGKGDAAAAEKTLLHAVEVEPRFLEAHKALLVYRLEANDVEGMKKRLAEARKVAPKHSTTLYMTALTAFAEGDMPRAREALQPLLKVNNSSGQLQLLAGLIEFNANSLLKAETHLTKGLQLLPEETQPRIMLADLYVRRDQPEKALNALGPLLEQKPPLAEAVGAAADIYMHMGDMARAEAMYTTAARLAPDSSRTKVALAAARLARGAGESELRELESLGRLSKPTEVFAEMALFNARLRLKDLDGAMKAADAMAQKQPKQATPWILKTGIYELKSDATNAKASLERALQLDPLHFRAALRLAAYDTLGGNFDAAIKRFDSLLKSDANHTPARLAVVDLKRRAGAKPEELVNLLEAAVRDDPANAVARVKLVEELMRQDQTAKALDAAQAAVAALPNDPRVYGMLGEAQMRSGNVELAIGSFGKLSNLSPKEPYPPFRLAEAQLSAGQRKAAMASLRHSLELQPNFLASQRALAAIMLRSGDAAGALKLARTIQSQRPKEDIGFLLEGDIESSRKNWAGAGAAYRNALDRRASGEVASKLYQLQINAGNATAAAQFESQWRKTHPNDVQFISYLGEQALTAGRFADAETLIREIIKLVPARATAWSNLAYCLLEQKKPGAQEAASKALELAPQDPNHHQMLALALAADGALPKAITSQREAIRLSGGRPNFRFGLAKLLLQSGDKAAAKAELQSLAGIKDAFAGKEQLAGLLQGL